MTATPEELLKTVASEAQQIQQFVDLLEEEQSSLKEGSTEALPSIAEQKQNLAAQLNNLARRRNDLLLILGHTADRAGMDAWAEEYPQAADEWSKTLALATKAREINHLNGKLIQMRMQHNSRALDILLRKENTLDLYGPDGKASGQGDRRIDDAV